MALITRTASIQARVVPFVKEASEQVLHRIGLNMSEAIELFLRQVIVQERIPFEIVALDIHGEALLTFGDQHSAASKHEAAGVLKTRKGKEGRERASLKKNSKSFSTRG